MITPTTYISALLLLIASFLCLGSWPATFKLVGPRWRFELFAIDFAIGAALLSIMAAFTLGSLGSDLAFTDRMLVAGHAAQVFLIAAGFIFNLGNMLLLAAASILGIAGAFPLSIGIALVVSSFFNFHANNVLFLVFGIVLMLVAVLLDGSACRLRDRTAPKARPVAKHAPATTPGDARTTHVAGPTTASKAPLYSKGKLVKSAASKQKARRTTKGLLLGVLGGMALGLFYPVAARGMSGEFGLGPYAGMLLFSVGVFMSTIMFNFYFLNIAIEGEPLSFGAYFKGDAPQHFLGFAGGALWAAGMLAASLAISAPQEAGLSRALAFMLPIASVLLVILWGSIGWKEFALPSSSGGKLPLGLSAAFFACSLILLGIGIVR